MMLFPQMTHATVIGENFLSILQRLRMNHLRKLKSAKKENNQILTSFLIIFSVT
jgi:hypothetical protein